MLDGRRVNNRSKPVFCWKMTLVYFLPTLVSMETYWVKVNMECQLCSRATRFVIKTTPDRIVSGLIDPKGLRDQHCGDLQATLMSCYKRWLLLCTKLHHAMWVTPTRSCGIAQLEVMRSSPWTVKESAFDAVMPRCCRLLSSVLLQS